MTVKRNPTREVRVGNITIGGSHPVAVQSMCATRTQDVDATIAQAEAIRQAGGDVVRIAVDNPKDVEALSRIRQSTTANLVGRPAGELPAGREGGALRRQGPLQPRAPVPPREDEARAQRRSVPGGRGPRARLRHPRRGQLRQRRSRAEGANHPGDDSVGRWWSRPWSTARCSTSSASPATWCRSRTRDPRKVIEANTPLRRGPARRAAAPRA